MALGDYRGPLSWKPFVRYTIARYNQSQTRLTCAMYIAKALQEAGRGYYLTTGLMEVLNPNAGTKDRSAEEIIDDIASRLEG